VRRHCRSAARIGDRRGARLAHVARSARGLGLACGLGVGLIGNLIRRNIDETVPERTTEHTAIVETLRNHWGLVGRIAALAAFNAVPFYLLFVYLVSVMQLQDGFTPAQALLINSLSMTVLLPCMMVSAWLTDIYGRKPVLLVAIGLGFITAWPLFGLMHQPDPVLVFAGQLGAAIFVGFFTAAFPALIVESTPAEVRCTAVALGYNLSIGIVGGLTPFFATLLVAYTGHPLAPAFLIMAAASVAFRGAQLLRNLGQAAGGQPRHDAADRRRGSRRSGSARHRDGHRRVCGWAGDRESGLKPAIPDHDRIGPHQSKASIIGPIKTLEPHCNSKKKDSALGDDVGEKLILDGGHAVFDRELLLFQPFHEELIGGRGILERNYLVVELTVFSPQPRQFVSQISIVDALHCRPVNAPASPARERADYRLVPCIWQVAGPAYAHILSARRRLAHATSPVRPSLRFASKIRLSDATLTLDKLSMFCHAGSSLQHAWRTMMALVAHIAELTEKHRLLERRIEEEVSRPGSDDLEIQRLKLEKLKLKDQITRLSENKTRH